MAIRECGTLCTKCDTRVPFRRAFGWRASWPVSRVLYRSGVTARPAMTIHLGRPLLDASCNQPGRSGWKSPRPTGFPDRPAPSLFGFAPGGVYLAAPVARSAVRSYRTLSPLLRQWRGGLLSVALSLGSPPPGVTRHRISMEPGLSSATTTGARRPDAGQRPSGQLAEPDKGCGGDRVKRSGHSSVRDRSPFGSRLEQSLCLRYRRRSGGYLSAAMLWE